MGLWICGDIHGSLEIQKLNINYFPIQKEMNKDDFVVILGDFGLVWDFRGESKEEKYWLDWLDEKNFTTLFIDGNHENFSRLNSEFSEMNFHGGRVHQIRPSVFHLMRGEIFDLFGQKCFVMGGASSHDIKDGIVDPTNWENGIYNKGFKKEINKLIYERKTFRIKDIDWWKEEMPTASEMLNGIKNLEKNNNKVDFVFTHCAPTSVIAQMGYYDQDKLTDFLNSLSFEINYKEWHFGHYHRDTKIAPNFYCHYMQSPWRIG